MLWGKVREAVALVVRFFNGDEEKIKAWFSTPNPLLGGISPIDMILWGDEDKLLDFIKRQLRGNEKATQG